MERNKQILSVDELSVNYIKLSEYANNNAEYIGKIIESKKARGSIERILAIATSIILVGGFGAVTAFSNSLIDILPASLVTVFFTAVALKFADNSYHKTNKIVDLIQEDMDENIKLSEELYHKHEQCEIMISKLLKDDELYSDENLDREYTELVDSYNEYLDELSLSVDENPELLYMYEGKLSLLK